MDLQKIVQKGVLTPEAAVFYTQIPHLGEPVAVVGAPVVHEDDEMDHRDWESGSEHSD